MPNTKYCKTSESGEVELYFSFSDIYKSFQVELKYAGRELFSFCSENVSLIEIRSNPKGLGIHIVFAYLKEKAEAEITLEPQLHCSWWCLHD
jgi:hypothetical protein